MARRAFFALALAALAAGLTACGVTRTVDPVAGAATKTQDSGGYRATFSMSISVAGTPMTMTGHGEFGSQQGEVVMDMPGVNGTIDAIYLHEDGDPVMYLRMGLLSAFMPGGKDWIRLDFAKAGKAAGLDLGKLMGSTTQNPADALQLLRQSGDFTEVGTDTVGGVSTTHYHGTVDLEKALAAKGAPDDLIQRLLDLGAPKQYPVDVWVDDSGYVRQVQMTYDHTTGGTTTSTSMTMDMSDYGTDVNVSAPPANEVFDATVNSGVH